MNVRLALAQDGVGTYWEFEGVIKAFERYEWDSSFLSAKMRVMEWNG
jgi:hypothetical protein